MSIYKLTTDNDCEGRTTKTIGFFSGDLNQIVHYCIANNIKPYNYFRAEIVNVVSVNHIKTNLNVKQVDYGRLEYKIPARLRLEAERSAAMAKLTEKEKKLLGLYTF